MRLNGEGMIFPLTDTICLDMYFFKLAVSFSKNEIGAFPIIGEGQLFSREHLKRGYSKPTVRFSTIATLSNTP